MKFIRFLVMPAQSLANVAAISDKTWNEIPLNSKMLANYLCQGLVTPANDLTKNLTFPDQPKDTVMSISVIESESAEELLTIALPLIERECAVWYVPVVDMEAGRTAEMCKHNPKAIAKEQKKRNR